MLYESHCNESIAMKIYATHSSSNDRQKHQKMANLILTRPLYFHEIS
jgi:hypothetical protein